MRAVGPAVEVIVFRTAVLFCLCLVALAVGVVSLAEPASSARPTHGVPSAVSAPPGVYLKLDIESAITGFLPVDHPPHPERKPPSVPQLHRKFRSLLQRVLGNAAVSGIAVGEHWDHIQMSNSSYPYEPVGGYDWSYLDDVFSVADHLHKPVQLLITPGANSPQALLDVLPSCNSLFAPRRYARPKRCGSVVFPRLQESIHADSDVLPLPWNKRYNGAWHGFLRLLNRRYRANREFAAIAVAGPVYASPEMILPTSENTHHKQVDGMWGTLISNAFPKRPGYRDTDAVFVDAWDMTIDFYEKLFSGVTLLLTPDSGSDLPDFSHQVEAKRGNDLYTRDCAASIAEADPSNSLYKDLMGCEAKTEILAYFVRVPGPNGKATRDGGMRAGSPATLQPGGIEVAGDIGVPGTKLLTELEPPPPILIGAGADFDFPVSTKTRQKEGCRTYPKRKCVPLTVTEAAANVLKVFFDHTSHGKAFGGTNGDGQVDFLGVPYLDVLYAERHPCAQLQDTLDAASQALTGQTVDCSR